MKKLMIGFATAAALGLAAPLFSNDTAAAQDRMQLAQADVRVKVKADGERRKVKKVVVKRGKMERRGATKKVIIKKRGDGVTKKKIIHRS